MALAGTLNILQSVTTGNFNKKLSDSSKRLDQFAAHFKTIGKSFGITLDLNGVLNGVKGFVASIKAGARAVADLEDEGASLNMTFQDFSKLRLATSLLGADPDSIPNALHHMTEGLHDAATVGSTLTGVLDNLGLSAKEMASKDTLSNFESIVDAMDGMNAAEREHFGKQIFGRGGKELQVMLGNVGALKKAFEQIQELHVGLDPKEVDQIGRLDEAFLRLKVVADGFWNKITAAVAPELTKAVEKMIEWGVAAIDSIKGVKDALSKIVNIAKGIGSLLVDGFKFALAGITYTIAKIKHQFVQLAAFLTDLAERFVNMFRFKKADFGAKVFKDEANNQAVTLGKLALGLGVMWTNAATKGEGVIKNFKDFAAGVKGLVGPPIPQDVLDKRNFVGPPIPKEIQDQRDEAKKKPAGMIDTEDIYKDIEARKLEHEQFGRSDDQKRIAEYERHGATIKQLDPLKHEMRNNSIMTTAESLLNPLQRAAKEVEEMNYDVLHGLKSPMERQMKLAEISEKYDLNGINGRSGAMEAGSSEARETILNFEQNSQNPQKDILRNAEATLVATQNVGKNTGDMLSVLNKLKVVGVK